jgi:ribA/ribD-fused uncharacterized protein
VSASIEEGTTGSSAAIRSFDGDNRFLSNFWPTADGRSNEHWYQASKCTDPAARERILALPTPGAAKRAGQEAEVLPYWDDIKVQVMADGLARKFAEPELGTRLLMAGDVQLIEGNDWGDVFWGVDKGTGEGRNVLGILLMGVRASLRASRTR